MQFYKLDVDEIWHHSAIASLKWKELDKYVTKHWLRELDTDDAKEPYEELTYHDAKKQFQAEGGVMAPEWHLRRILHLSKHGWSDAIVIEVEEDGSYQILDGNHRLVAAIFLGYKTIEVEFCGFVDELDSIFKTLV